VIVMIESLKSATGFNNGIAPSAPKDPGRREPLRKVAMDDIVPLRQPDGPGEAATLSAAIQRLIGERDTHRARAGAQEQEIVKLRAINDELRRQHEQTALIRDHYMRLATEVLTTLKQIDSTIHEVVQKTLGTHGEAEGRDAALVSLARRLSPKGTLNGRAELQP
jgi:hypothetical protein